MGMMVVLAPNYCPTSQYRSPKTTVVPPTDGHPNKPGTMTQEPAHPTSLPTKLRNILGTNRVTSHLDAKLWFGSDQVQQHRKEVGDDTLAETYRRVSEITHILTRESIHTSVKGSAATQCNYQLKPKSHLCTLASMLSRSEHTEYELRHTNELHELILESRRNAEQRATCNTTTGKKATVENWQRTITS